MAEALAEAALPAEPSQRLRGRILGTALTASGQQNHRASRPEDAAREHTIPPEVVPLRRSRAQRWRRPAAAAAAAALIAAGGIWAGLNATSSGQQAPLAGCAHPHACSQVVLIAPASHRAAAKVVVSGGVVWMEAAAMTANPSGEIYVLWQITGAHTPLPVGSFDLRTGTRAPIRIGGLTEPLSATWAFAVSLEHGRTIPASPSKPVALGQVT